MARANQRHGIPRNHVIINTGASYKSMPYPEIFTKTQIESRGLVGHSNMGSTTMNMTGSLGSSKDFWVNNGRVATVIPRIELAKTCPITYESTEHGELFVAWSAGRPVVLTMIVVYRTSTSPMRRQAQSYPLTRTYYLMAAPLCRQFGEIWRDSPGAKWRKQERCAKCRQ